MDLAQKIDISDTVFAQEVDDEMVLLEMGSENYFGLDENGKVFWRAMEEHRELEEVYRMLLGRFDVEPEVLKRDLLDFVSRLAASGLIKVERL